jgi:hypothetical protein
MYAKGRCHANAVIFDSFKKNMYFSEVNTNLILQDYLNYVSLVLIHILFLGGGGVQPSLV